MPTKTLALYTIHSLLIKYLTISKKLTDVSFPYSLLSLLTHYLEALKNGKGLIEVIKNFNKEAVFAFVIGFIVIFTMSPGFLTTSIVFITRDINDADDISRAKIFQFIYASVEFVLKILVTYFQLFTWRKPFFMTGIFMFFLGWSGISLSYFIDVPILAGCSGLLIILGFGPVLIPGFSILMGEICPREFVGIGFAIY